MKTVIVVNKAVRKVTLHISLKDTLKVCILKWRLVVWCSKETNFCGLRTGDQRILSIAENIRD